MQRYLGIDAHSKSSTIYVMNAAGKKVRQDALETNGQALTAPGRSSSRAMERTLEVYP